MPDEEAQQLEKLFWQESVAETVDDGGEVGALLLSQELQHAGAAGFDLQQGIKERRHAELGSICTYYFNEKTELCRPAFSLVFYSL